MKRSTLSEEQAAYAPHQAESGTPGRGRLPATGGQRGAVLCVEDSNLLPGDVVAIVYFDTKVISP
jgi:hypothetical protein